MRLGLCVSRVGEVVGAFVGGEAFEECSNTSPCCLMGPLGGFAHEMLELGEDLLDRVEIRALGRQEKKLGTDAAGGVADVIAHGGGGKGVITHPPCG